MSNLPDAAWVEAAHKAAARTFDAIGPMDDLSLEISLVSQEDATAENCGDDEFLDYLVTGAHLGPQFLANAK